MKRKEFKEAIRLSKLFLKQERKFNKIGLDLYESKYPISETFGKLLDLFFNVTLTESGNDTVNWWMWENRFGKEGLKYEDSQGEEIFLDTIDDLYDYIQADIK